MNISDYQPSKRLPLTFAAAILFAVSAAVFSLAAQTPSRGAAASAKNPVEKTPESIAAGKRVYARLCLSCHGQQGKGDGGGAGGGGIPADLTDRKWDHGGTDGEIFTAIHDGVSQDMQGYAEQINDQDIWNLVNFIRSIGPQANEARSTRPAGRAMSAWSRVQATPWAVRAGRVP